MEMHEHAPSGGFAVEAIGILFFAGMVLLYLLAVHFSNYRYKPWPLYRIFFWFAGIFSAGAALIGPISEAAHSDFKAHMLAHLLLGMLAPILLALSAPMTLVFRTVSVRSGRRLSRLLKSRPLRFFSHPLTASILNIGGLFVLYTTGLFQLMHENHIVYILVHIHIFLAGYLFTIAIIYIDPAPHRFSFIYRSAILILALAGHGILAKYIYANPPASVPRNAAEAGGMLMYYGGDAVDVLLIIILCWQWYKSERPRLSAAEDVAN